jgi:hypothetical protein
VILRPKQSISVQRFRDIPKLCLNPGKPQKRFRSRGWVLARYQNAEGRLGARRIDVTEFESIGILE